MILLRLAFLSLRNRWLTAMLTVIAIAVSVALLLGVEKVRNGARASFADTISGTDLIIGCTDRRPFSCCCIRCSGLAMRPITSVGRATRISRNEVRLRGPSHSPLVTAHRGFRVLGTNDGLFQAVQIRGGQSLDLRSRQRV